MKLLQHFEHNNFCKLKSHLNQFFYTKVNLPLNRLNFSRVSNFYFALTLLYFTNIFCQNPPELASIRPTSWTSLTWASRWPIISTKPETNHSKRNIPSESNFWALVFISFIFTSTGVFDSRRMQWYQLKDNENRLFVLTWPILTTSYICYVKYVLWPW